MRDVEIHIHAFTLRMETRLKLNGLWREICILIIVFLIDLYHPLSQTTERSYTVVRK